MKLKNNKKLRLKHKVSWLSLYLFFNVTASVKANEKIIKEII